MRNYLNLLKDIMKNGEVKGDRTGTGTISVFGRTMRFDLSKGFPLITTKKMHTKSIFHELLFFLSGETNNNYLKEKGVTIWNEWESVNGELGRIYSSQWRDFTGYDEQGNRIGIDQISQVIEQIKNDPDSRRHLVNAWNPAEIDEAALPPCHYAFQFYVCNGKLSCMFQMRSIDTFLGLGFNIASYALLTHLVAAQCDLEVGELIWNGGDTHIYLNHVDQVNLQITRKPLKLPKLVLKRKPDSIFDYKYEDIEIVNYKHYDTIKAPISK